MFLIVVDALLVVDDDEMDEQKLVQIMAVGILVVAEMEKCPDSGDQSAGTIARLD